MKNFRLTIILLAAVLAGCSPRITNLDTAEGDTIVCFGDSITEGVGAGQDESYPSILGQMVDRVAVNEGVAGDTTADALARIDHVVAHDPYIVVVILGGNDFMRKVPKEKVVANMRKIVDYLQKKGAVVAIATVKFSVLYDIYTKEFKRIAQEKGCLFIPNITKGIYTNPKLKFDQIHPNADGYRLIAERVHKAIKPLL